MAVMDSSTEGEARAKHLRKIRRIAALIQWIGVPLLGLGFLAILKAGGYDWPLKTDWYNSAQLAGFLVLLLVGTTVCLVGPWIFIVWQLRRWRTESVSEANGSPSGL